MHSFVNSLFDISDCNNLIVEVQALLSLCSCVLKSTRIKYLQLFSWGIKHLQIPENYIMECPSQNYSQ